MSKGSKIEIRKVRPSDSEALLAIQNPPAVDIYCRNRRQIAPDEHHQWFSVRLAKYGREKYYVATVDGQVAGYLRYDLVADYYDIGIAIPPPK